MRREPFPGTGEHFPSPHPVSGTTTRDYGGVLPRHPSTELLAIRDRDSVSAVLRGLSQTRVRVPSGVLMSTFTLLNDVWCLRSPADGMWDLGSLHLSPARSFRSTLHPMVRLTRWSKGPFAPSLASGGMEMHLVMWLP